MHCIIFYHNMLLQKMTVRVTFISYSDKKKYYGIDSTHFNLINVLFFSKLV